ncbi:hypothetical protein [Nocardioides ginsengisoli]|uniref:hypothetical protein n=1 Tax=Nocardioides ginsengisoli TaxID=363868 RepID=UPI00349E8A85
MISLLLHPLFLLAWWLLRLVARFVSGRPLNGIHRTDANFFSAGTEDTGDKPWFAPGAPTQWSYLPGYKRLASRLLVVGSFVAYLRWPRQLQVIGVVTAGVVLGVAVWRAYVAFTLYRHRRDVVIPVHVAFCGLVGHPSSIQAEDWVEIPVDYLTNLDMRISLHLPEDFQVQNAKHIQEIAMAVCRKIDLDFDEVQVLAHPQTSAPWLELRHAPKVPRLVLASDLFDAMEKQPASAPVIGLTAGDQVVATDLDDEAPHTLLSMSTGGGKSNYAYGQACQLLHNGALVIILDYKRTSLKYLRDHPNVVYVRDIKDIHNTLLWLALEGEMRNKMTDDLDDDEVLPFTRIFTVCEEQNVTVRKLSRYWKKHKEKSDPDRSPAVDALEDVASMGRTVLENLLAIFQFGSSNAAGGSAIRENYGNRVLARYSNRAWQMLAPEISPMPKKSDIPGRVQVVRASRAIETQVALWSKEDIRTYAWSGDFSQLPKLALGFLPVGEGLEKLSALLSEDELPTAGPAPVHTVEQVRELEPAEELITLRQAVELGIEAVQPDGNDTFEKALMRIRKASQDPEFPEPAVRSGAGNKWNREAVDFYYRNRIRSRVLEAEEVFD